MSQKMQEYLKAEVLIEALPYIQRFNRKIIVVKYGGSAMIDETLKKRVIEDVTLFKIGRVQTNHCPRRRERDQPVDGEDWKAAYVCQRTSRDG